MAIRRSGGVRFSRARVLDRARLSKTLVAVNAWNEAHRASRKRVRAAGSTGKRARNRSVSTNLKGAPERGLRVPKRALFAPQLDDDFLRAPPLQDDAAILD